MKKVVLGSGKIRTLMAVAFATVGCFFISPYSHGLSSAPVPKTLLRHLNNDAFTVGERLTFDISYGFITAGHAVMSIPGYKYVNGRKTYETRVEASSTDAFDWVFKVRDRYETFMDVDGIFPWRFEQHVREGSYSHDYTAFFDPEDQTAESSDGQTYQI